MNLTDVLVKSGQPGAALRAAEAALPIVRRHHDLRAERVLTHNAALAKVGLHRFAEARQDLNQVLALWQRIGATGDQAQALREFGEALGRAGDTQGALALYHRERELAAATMAENRRSALQTLQARNEMQRKERDIELLGRDNALKAQALDNRSLTQRVWLLVALAMALSAALVVLLYRRVRETNRRLVASHAQLRVQSERDPLTNLANRRHFQSVMQQRDALRGFVGALLLVDIDHFKHVNDDHGHGVGDVVLCEVARRLNEAVRTDDLVVRWGGEEFLILALDVRGEALDALAARVLQALADTPFDVTLRAEPGRPVAATASLRVTVSIGYGSFPAAAASRDGVVGAGAEPGRHGALHRQEPGPQPRRRAGRDRRLGRRRAPLGRSRFRTRLERGPHHAHRDARSEHRSLADARPRRLTPTRIQCDRNRPTLHSVRTEPVEVPARGFDKPVLSLSKGSARTGLYE